VREKASLPEGDPYYDRASTDADICKCFELCLTPGFQPYVSVLRIHFRNRCRKKGVRIAVP